MKTFQNHLLCFFFFIWGRFKFYKKSKKIYNLFTNKLEIFQNNTNKIIKEPSLANKKEYDQFFKLVASFVLATKIKKKRKREKKFLYNKRSYEENSKARSRLHAYDWNWILI